MVDFSRTKMSEIPLHKLINACIEQTQKLLVIRNGATILTPHGVGTIANFEVYPPLCAAESKTRQKWVGPDIVDEFPHDAMDGSFIRIGVKGCHPTLDVAYYTVDEIKPTP